MNPAFDPQAAAVALAAATELLTRCQVARQDELDRPRPLLTKMADWVSKTPIEKELEAAERALEVLRAGLPAQVSDWVCARRDALMTQAPAPQQAQCATLVQAYKATSQRLVASNEFRGLLSRAESSLQAAVDDCESASSTELLDMCTNNSGIALISHMETSDAADSVKSARHHLARLADRLKKAKGGEGLLKDAPDDLMDLMLDSVMPFDLFSYMNMEKLDESAESCRAALAKLEPLRAQVDRIHAQVVSRAQAADQALKAHEAPFRAQALAELPQALHEFWAAPTAKVQRPR